MRDSTLTEGTHISSQELVSRLEGHPILKARMIGLLELVEQAGSVALADEAERRVIDELRGMGNALLTDWAQRRVVQTAQETVAPQVTKHEKKSCAGTAPTAPLRSESRRTGIAPTGG